MENSIERFLHISTHFGNPEERTVERLAAVYNDSDELGRSIRQLIGRGIHAEVIRDKKVLLKPNWVKQSRNAQDDICLRTNDNFIVAALKVILEMRPAEVLIGDAPIQGCDWEAMLSPHFMDEITELSREYEIPVVVKDFRRRTLRVRENRPESGIRPLSEYLIFDLGNESMIEPITLPGQSRFRVTDYDPDRMSSAHAPGIHKYCISRDFFDADVIISLPKVKTHQKAGITAAMKNLVGINGDKDFLPHHRIGGTKMGGDCYPGGSVIRFWAERALDKANRRQGKKSYWFWKKLSSLLWKLSLPGPEHQKAAGWHGNDTTWRMVQDLNRIAEYGDRHGNLNDRPQRQLFSLCDGIIGGQGDGPLEPDPLPLGIVSFTNSSLLNDRAMALLMGMPPEKIPLLSHPMNETEDGEAISLNGVETTLEELEKLKISATPPPGWIRYFKSTR